MRWNGTLVLLTALVSDRTVSCLCPQCGYNVTFKRLPLTIVAMEKQKYYIFWVCFCSFTYPACKAHASYCIVLCGLTGSTIFFHIISQTARFSGKKMLIIKCVFWFSLQLLSETFPVLKRNEQDIIYIYIYIGLHVKYPLLFCCI